MIARIVHSRSSMLGLMLILSSLAFLTGCAPAAQPAPTAVAVQPTEPPAAALAPTATPMTAAQPVEAPQPTEAPTSAPTSAPEPTVVPTEAPTAMPTEAPAPTLAPTDTPLPAPTETPAQAAAVTFSKDIQPLFEQRCINCHGGKDGIKGGLSMKTYADLMKGGESGAAIVAGDPANSLLVQLIVKGEMPKRAPKLPQAEIDLISAWVAAGAKND